jgi:hypothetical protein
VFLVPEPDLEATGTILIVVSETQVQQLFLLPAIQNHIYFTKSHVACKVVAQMSTHLL